MSGLQAGQRCVETAGELMLAREPAISRVGFAHCSVCFLHLMRLTLMAAGMMNLATVARSSVAAPKLAAVFTAEMPNMP
jgi:hypothetical protein